MGLECSKRAVSPDMPKPTVADDPTRSFICEALASDQRDVALTVNPAFRSLQAVLREGSLGNVRLAFTPGPDTVQGLGVVGGGTLANMLDCAIAVAVLSALPVGAVCTTISLTVNMMRGAPLGRFTAAASVDRLGRRVAFGQAQLFDAEERLIASATAALAIVPLKSGTEPPLSA